MTYIAASVLAASVNDKITPLEALLIALIGMAIVFAVLAVIMFSIWLMGIIVTKSPQFAEKHPEFSEKAKRAKEKIAGIGKKKKVAETEDSVALSVGSSQSGEPAQGSFGEIKLINTTEREAAMIMAIVADATGSQLNTLRFKSIKNVGEGEEEK